MKEINKKLQEKLAKLEAGELELNELESLVDNARELYERLLIVKYKAYESYGEPTVETTGEEAEIQEEPEEIIEEEVIDFSGITEEAEEEKVQPSFDFSGIEEEIEETEKIEDDITDLAEEEDEHEDEKSEDIFKESHVEKVEPEDENSLNQKLHASEDELSLRKKLQRTPISDLKSEISIAKKFEYITFMFEGRNETYEQAIQTLNSCKDGEEAKDKLNEYSTRFNWDLENKSIIKFVELVERRYL